MRDAKSIPVTPTEQDIANLLMSITSRDPRARSAAAEALGARGEGAAALRVALHDQNPLVRRAAAQALGNPLHTERTEIIDDLRSCIHDANDHVAAAAIYALGRLGATEAVDDIGSYLHTSSALVRLAAVRALGTLDARAFAAPIAAMLDVPSPKLRAYAIAVLHRLNHRDSAPRIYEILQECVDRSSDDLIINHAVHALAEFEYTAAATLLVEIARTRFGHRTHAVRALLRLKAYDVAPYLVDLFAEDTASLPQALTEFMIAADHRRALPYIRRLLTHPLHHVRLTALKAVAVWNDRASLPQIRFMARHEGDPLLASQAMATCYAFHAASAEQDLVQLAKGSRTQIARIASDMLREHGVSRTELHAEIHELALTLDDPEVVASLRQVQLRSRHAAAPDIPDGQPVDHEVAASYLAGWLQSLSPVQGAESEQRQLRASLEHVLQAMGQPVGTFAPPPPVEDAA